MGMITVVGTGWTTGQLTLDAIQALSSGARVILHTDRCGCADWLREKGIAFESLDALYDRCDDFDQHADAAAQAVLDAAGTDDIVYGVFDVRDRSACRLVERDTDRVRVVAGPPAEGALLAFAQGEMRCVEASDWEEFHLTARENCYVREVDGQALAGEVKLRLMEVYPEESSVWVLSQGENPRAVPLYALDREGRFDHTTCVLVPAQRDWLKLERYDYGHLGEIIQFLCSPNGCPWDRVQTHETLRPCILEEAYEVMDAIDEGSPEHLYDELGDMLLQIALHVEIGRKHGEFDASDVATAICEKMIHRHTHVFGGDRAGDAGEVLGLWSKNKMAERGQTSRAEAMREITRTLPATLRASKLYKRAGEAGLGEADASGALETCRARIVACLEGAVTEETFGDALMAMCNVARLGGIDPEIALDRACRRFIERFDAVEQEIRGKGLDFEALSAETLRKYWDLVKL